MHLTSFFHHYEMDYIIKGFGPPTLSGIHNPIPEVNFTGNIHTRYTAILGRNIAILFTVVSTECKTVPKNMNN